MRLTSLAVLIFFFAAPAGAQQAGWEKEWNRLLSEGKKEGKVVVAGSPDQVVRKDLPAAFRKRFGISLEYLGGRDEVAQRLRLERRVGITTIDAYFSGLTTFTSILYPDKLLDPVKPALILPEVVDPSKWKKGAPWFVDPEEKYILRLYNYVSSGGLAVNTQQVKPNELKSIKELLHPKWTGKISVFDPTTGSGPGFMDFAAFYFAFGEEFVRRLYVDQRPALSRDGRQLADWLARGTYPLSLGRESDVKYMKEQGFPVDVVSLADAPRALSAGNGLVALINQAPHPNAARIFINWIASKEGLEILGRARGRPTTRNDIDESYAPPWEIPVPGMNYFDSYNWNYTVNELPKLRDYPKKLLGSR